MASSTNSGPVHASARRSATGWGLTVLPIAAALLIIGAPLTAASNVSPAYHGTEVPSVYLSDYGCSKEKLTNPDFSMKKGTGQLGSISGRSTSCGTPSLPTSSYVEVQTAVTANILLHIPKGVHNVTPTVDASWTASDRISYHGGCPVTATTSHKRLNETKRLGHFDLYWSNVTTYYGYCAAEAYVDIAAEIFLIDETNSSYIPVTAAGGCTYAYPECYVDMVDNETYVYNSTYWTSYTDTNLNASGYSYTNGTANFNSSGLTSWTSLSTKGSDSVSPSFVDRFDRSHTYYLEVSFYGTFELQANGWPGAGALGKLGVSGTAGGISVPYVKIV